MALRTTLIRVETGVKLKNASGDGLVYYVFVCLVRSLHADVPKHSVWMTKPVLYVHSITVVVRRAMSVAKRPICTRYCTEPGTMCAADFKI